MSIKDEIYANPACAAAIAAKDCQAIAAIMPARKVANAREIGNGTIIETLGLVDGNVFLDVVLSSAADSPFRHVKPLIEQGRLLIGSALVQATIQSMVPSILSQAKADLLCALGKDSVKYTVQEVAQAIFNEDGSVK